MTAVLIYYTDAKVTLRFDKQGLSEGMALFPMERLGAPQDYHWVLVKVISRLIGELENRLSEFNEISAIVFVIADLV